jgi:hypothetical protein
MLVPAEMEAQLGILVPSMGLPSDNAGWEYGIGATQHQISLIGALGLHHRPGQRQPITRESELGEEIAV